LGEIGICVKECPTTSGEIVYFYDIDGTSELDDYYVKSYPTQLFKDRVCVPFDDPVRLELIYSYIRSFFETFRMIAKDMWDAKDIFLEGLFVIYFLGLFFMLTMLLKPTSTVFTWIYILGVPG